MARSFLYNEWTFPHSSKWQFPFCSTSRLLQNPKYGTFLFVQRLDFSAFLKMTISLLVHKSILQITQNGKTPFARQVDFSTFLKMAISLLFHKGLSQRKCAQKRLFPNKEIRTQSQKSIGGPELLLLRAKFFVWEQSILVNFRPCRLSARSHGKQGGRIIYKRMLRKKRTFGATHTQNKPLNWTVSKTEISRKRCLGTFATFTQEKHSNWMVSNTEISRKWCLGTFATLMQNILPKLTLSKTEISRKTCFGTFATRRIQNIRVGRCSKLQ